MSFITNDTFPIEEIKKFLTGKGFCRQSKNTKAKVAGVIQDISLSFKIVFDADQEKVFFKPVIQIQSTKGVWYDLCEIWIQSVMPYQDYGGTMIMEAVNNPFLNGIKLPEEFTKHKQCNEPENSHPAEFCSAPAPIFRSLYLKKKSL